MHSQPTPRQLGFRMPAEWEHQEGVWLSWPHREESWPDNFEPVPAVFGQIAAAISEEQFVRINVANQAMADEATEHIKIGRGNLNHVTFHFNPTNDAWARDHGPIYVVRDESGIRHRAITKWGYNAWGDKYPPYDLDNAIPLKIAAEFQETIFQGGMILEGGAIDVNGAGLLLTTEACLLNKNRNPTLSKSQIEERLSDFLGIQKVLWLGDGIEGDDTDGHIDDITRFVSENTILTVIENNKSDSNYAPLQENLERLKSFRNLENKPFEVVTIPMPDPVVYDDMRLPASYANFLIINKSVLVPTYRCAKDEEALNTLQELFPTRKVVGIDCTELVWGLGAIHCISQQQPSQGTILTKNS